MLLVAELALPDPPCGVELPHPTTLSVANNRAELTLTSRNRSMTWSPSLAPAGNVKQVTSAMLGDR
ncbi:MAG TPA: hypothetical protein VHO01_10445 [Jatrophihabitans sp.]|nr:hypothetical protein [Jatrophihabitans sp.]